MLQLMLGLALGFVSGYLYGSERARNEVRRRLANAPEPVRQVTERVSGAFAETPVSDTLKQAATRATATIERATERAAETAGAASELVQQTAAETAARPGEPLPRPQP
jgi:hypothetical protein